MSNGKYYGVKIGTIILCLLVIIVLWSYVQSMTDSFAIQKFSAIATAIAAVGGFLAFLVLVFYTIETRLLRKATEEQLEGTTKPVLFFEISSQDRQLGEAMILTPLHLKNVGAGPGFDVTLDPIIGNNVQLGIDKISLIEAKDTKQVEWCVSENGQMGGMAKNLTRLASHIEGGRFGDVKPVTVKCRGLSGKRYRILHHLHYDSEQKRVWTEFMGIETITGE